jgi:uncharacterized OsmC-like protein
MTKPLKRWSVNAVSDGRTPLKLFCDDRPVGRGAVGTTQELSPVQYLLISVAGCFALSCREELRQRQLHNIPFEVVVMGDKDPGAVRNLLHAISIVTIFGGGITESLAREITSRAKPLCTVTNTLLEPPTIEFRARATLDVRAASHDFPAQDLAHDH